MTRSTGARERAAAVRMLRSRIGKQVAELRTDAGVTRAELARCAGIDPAHVWRIEAGEASPSVDAMVSLSMCLGAEPAFRLFPTSGPRIHDRFQAPMIEALLRVRHSSWGATPELPVPAARGVIDLVLVRAGDRCTVACECHSELRRLELVIRRATEKAHALATRFEGGPPASSLLLLRSTASTRAVARAYEATLSAAFPGRAADAYAALTVSGVPWPGSTILWARLESGRAEILDRPPRSIRVGA